ncbi:hypothetical protein, partial [Escherichia coli]|uniref:hypothetical protein n=1 Tax=Escherichia coli TaxID=562 RepID=UPI001ABC1552
MGDLFSCQTRWSIEIIFSLTLALSYEVSVHVLRRSLSEAGLSLTNSLREGANKRGNTSRLTQSFHFFMFEPIFSPVNALNQPI